MSLRPHLVITGPMGVGKSTTAAAVADAIGVPWHDSDRDLDVLFGRTGAQLVDAHGVDELHRLESAVLLGRLASDASTVIAAAAWVVEDAACRTAMKRRSRVVVLDAPVDLIVERMQSGGHRRDMSRAEVAALAARREPFFDEVADLRIDAHRPPAELARLITTT